MHGRSTLASPLLGDSILQQQINLEQEAIARGIERYRRNVADAMERDSASSLPPVERIIRQWLEPLSLAIKKEVRSIRSGKYEVGRMIHGPMILSLARGRSRKIALVVLDTMLDNLLCPKGQYAHLGVPAADISYQVGAAIIGQARYDTMQPKDRAELTSMFRRLTFRRLNWWANRNMDNATIERQATVQLGARFVWLCIENLSCSTDETFKIAFHSKVHPIHGKGGIRRMRFISLDDVVWNAIEHGHVQRQTLRPRYLPMIVPAYKATDAEVYNGGYVSIRTPLVSSPTRVQRKVIKSAHESGELSKPGGVYESLAAFGAMPWAVNEDVLKVQRELWNQGGAVAGIPRKDKRDLPPHGEWDEMTPEQRKAWKIQAASVHSANATDKTERLIYLERLNIADKFVGRPFYYPHMMDFRGRCYPVPPMLTHYGDDVCRGLLQIGQAKPLTSGEHWRRLRIHAANCWAQGGLDKKSFDDREAWTVLHMPQIQAVAANPVDDPWWQAAEDPWQFLAACFALCDPEKAALLPVRADGTANALQQYAALARDPVAANAVNLAPMDRPNDYYAVVAEAVRERVREDIANGHPLAEKCLPLIDRGVVKQPSMTKYYNVTRSGVWKQVRGKLMDRGMSRADAGEPAKYIGNAIIAAMANAMPAANAVMDWIVSAAKVVVDKDRPLMWTTPIGLPVVQPYRQWRSMRLCTALRGMTISMNDENCPINKVKQVSGSLPNYVHGVDGAHACMSVTEASRRGVWLSTVHDAFITHAATGGEMDTIIREQFVALHRRPLLEELREQLALVAGEELPPLPARGDFNIESVLHAPYAFS